MERFWEVDFTRGIAIIMVVLFHLIFDLYYFNASDTSPFTGFWFFFGRIAGFLFVFLVGFSLTLSFSRTNYSAGWWKYAKRGAEIFGLGIIVSIVTFLILPSTPILFGVLHLIGLSIMIAYPFLRFIWQNFAIGVLFILLGLNLSSHTFDSPYLLFLGLAPKFAMLDYYPLLPWFGVVLLGIFTGNLLYKNYKRQYSIFDLSTSAPARLIGFFGRNTLLIYLIHQPILLAILHIAGVINVALLFS